MQPLPHVNYVLFQSFSKSLTISFASVEFVAEASSISQNETTSVWCLWVEAIHA